MAGDWASKARSWRLWVGLAVLAAVLGAGWRFWWTRPAPATVDPPRYEITKTVAYSFTLKNGTGRLLEGGEFWTYAPHRETASQRCCERLDASAPYTLEADASGNQVLHFRLAPLPPYATRIIRVTAGLRMAAVPNRLPGVPAASATTAERFIESDHPLILTRAAALKGRDALGTARRTFDWAAQNVRDSGYVREERGALYALQQQRGDCTESMDLFLALARANGIPAQAAAGYVVAGSGVLRPAGYHNWAYFYADGTWRISDPQRRVFAAGDADYVAMRVGSGATGLDARRYWSSGAGLEARMD